MKRRIGCQMGCGSNLAPLVHLNEMGKNVARCGPRKRWGQPRVDRLHNGRDIMGAFAQNIQDGRIAPLPMGDDLGDARVGVDDRGTMRRIEYPAVPLAQAFARPQKITHVTVRRRHKRGRPPHNEITDESHIAPMQRDVIAHVAGRMGNLQRPAGPLQNRTR